MECENGEVRLICGYMVQYLFSPFSPTTIPAFLIFLTFPRHRNVRYRMMTVKQICNARYHENIATKLAFSL